MMKATALVNGAATVVAAFATGKGGAFGIGLENSTTVELNKSRKFVNTVNGRKGRGDKLALLCVKKTLKRFGVNYSGAIVDTETNIPEACGLKSSSVAANAIVLATAGAIAREYGSIRDVKLVKGVMKQEITIKGNVVDPVDLVKIGVEAAKEAKVTVTGAFDDASASFFGGMTLTDNSTMKIVHKAELEQLNVLIHVPKGKSYSANVDVKKFKAHAKEADLIWNQALSGKLFSAVTLNGLLTSAILGYDPSPAIKAIEAGALAAGLSGKGPAVVAVTREDGARIKKAWKTLKGRIIQTKINSSRARIVG
ncbi:MAG: shikimate kinase [Candidatus Altiarchaeota archaeon]|nr:shikimate kinase [Candidatus Altiarchaeota archaeon]